MADYSEKFYLVRSDILPEAMKKTLDAKAMLDRGKVTSVYEAVQQVGLSRSAFYKYKDAVYPFQRMVKEQIVTLFFHLEDQKGSLSKLLSVAAEFGCNILTIHQTIPIQGKANVTLSLNTTGMTTEMNRLLQQLQNLEFVDNVEVLSSGA
ncbi:ACT domain-containing protein [Salimicrobium sp. PL1-032A]|uniref:ACT domain-containing protein n=1 Tax=Salimicrobium sp. PL1-032A TaxID=3095364 RepID=UPI00326015ED